VGVVASLLATVLTLQASPPARQEHAYALLADNRVVETALPSGKVVARRRVGAKPQGTSAEPGRMLAASDTRIFVLVAGGEGSDSVAVLDRRKATLLARWPLETGIRYRGIVFAADRLVAYGGRSGREVDTVHHLHEQSAVVTLLDAANGMKIRTAEMHPAEGRMWWIYWSSATATRVALSYHGGCYPNATQLCTSGADVLDLSGHTLTSLDEAHGMIEPYGVGWIATTGGESLVQYGSNGNVLRRLHSGIQHDHVMNFRFTRDRSGLLVISSCLYSHEGLRRISLKTGTSQLVRGTICGEAAVPARTALVVRQTAALDIRDPRTAVLRRWVSFQAKVLDVIVSG
jgi:hypothetical protein